MKNNGFGPHLMLDLNECNVDKLNNYKLIFDLLNTIPEKIGMTKISPGPRTPVALPRKKITPRSYSLTIRIEAITRRTMMPRIMNIV